MALEDAPIPKIDLPSLGAPVYQPRPYVGRMEAMSASFDSAIGATEVLGQITSFWDVSEIADDNNLDDIPAADLNDLYGHTGYKFTRPMSDIEARHIIEFVEEKNKYNDIVQNGPQDTLQTWGLNFAAGAAAHLTDPIEFGVGALTFGVGSAVVGRAASAFASQGAIRAAQIASTPLARLAAGSTAEVLATEPLAIAGEGLAGREYGINDFLFNASLGILLGTALDVSGTYVFGRNKNIADLVAHDPTLFSGAQAVSTSRVANDFMPRAELWMKHMENEVYARPPDPVLKEFGMAEYRYQGSVFDESGRISRPVFATTTKPQKGLKGNFGKTNSYKYGGDLADGLYFTDDPYLANNASLAHGEAGGSIFEVGVDRELRMIDLDKPLPESALSIYDYYKKTYFPDLPLGKTSIFGNPIESGKDLLETLRALDGSDFAPDFRYSDFINDLKAEGFDGFFHTAKGLGTDDSLRNVGVIFDEGAAKEVRKIKGDSKVKTEASETALKEMRESGFANESKLTHDPSPVQKMKEAQFSGENMQPIYGDRFKKTADRMNQDYKTHNQGLQDEIQMLANQFSDDVDVEKFMNEFKELDKNLDTGLEAIENEISCVAKDLI